MFLDYINYEFKNEHQCSKIEENYELKALERHICNSYYKEIIPIENSWFIIDAVPPQDDDEQIINLKDAISSFKNNKLQKRCGSEMCKGQNKDHDVLFEIQKMPRILIVLIKRYSCTKEKKNIKKLKTRINIIDQMTLQMK